MAGGGFGVKVGGWFKVTITLKETCPVLPLPSSAEQSTGVVPITKFEPGAGEQLTVND
jgi:hypothetical protein